MIFVRAELKGRALTLFGQPRIQKKFAHFCKWVSQQLRAHVGEGILTPITLQKEQQHHRGLARRSPQQSGC